MKNSILFLFVIVSFCSLLNSVTWHIKQDGSGNFTTIQEGINAAANSDTVLVYPGTYFENLVMNEKNIVLASLELTIGSPQYINSTIIDGQRLLSCIEIQNISNGATIRGFTIQNGFGTDIQGSLGGGIFAQCVENTIIKNCYFYNNISTLGGAICAILSELTLSGLRIVQNSAIYGGAIYARSNSTIQFDPNNRCNIYNNNAGKGADMYIQNTGHVYVIVDTFSVFNPDRYFAEYQDGSTYSFSIQHNWMELVPYDQYVSSDGDDANSGLTPEEPLRNISWAVRRISADAQNPRTVHVAAGTYSSADNQQIFPIGCKEYVSIIGEDMDATVLINDNATNAILGDNLIGQFEISNITVRNSGDMLTVTVLYFWKVDFVRVTNLTINNNNNIKMIILNAHVYNEYENLIITDNTTCGINSGLALNRNAGYLKNSIVANNLNTWPYSPEVALHLGADDDFLIENCIFTGNSAASADGRIIRTRNNNVYEPTIRLVNCLIADNYIGSNNVCQNFNYDGLTEYINCTVTNNTTGGNFYSTALYNYGDVNLKNTIMYNNTQYEVFMVDDTQYGYIYTLNVDHCDIRNGQAGIYNMNNVNIINWNAGNIDADPQYLGTGAHPYQLSATSPCIDAGTPDTTGLFLPPWDLLHHERIWDGDGNGIAVIDMGCYEFGADSVGVNQNLLPSAPCQLTNYPNPFNPSTTISFSIEQNEQNQQVELSIFNIKGQKVKTLLDCKTAPGKYNCIWNGRNDSGKRVSSGQYTARLMINGEEKAVRKIMLVK
jgi:predicted outer membrane repeat protein